MCPFSEWIDNGADRVVSRGGEWQFGDEIDVDSFSVALRDREGLKFAMGPVVGVLYPAADVTALDIVCDVGR